MNKSIELAAANVLIAQLTEENQLLRTSLQTLSEERRLKTVGQMIREEEARLCAKHYDACGFI